MAQPTKPGNPERGWNDPPVLLHSGGNLSSSQPTQKRSLLNKRVAFPVLGAGSRSSALPAEHDASLPPPVTAGSLAGTANNVVLLPPAATTAIPQGNAPIIVPNLSPPPVDGPLQTGAGLVKKTEGDRHNKVETPEFLNDQQMFNYVSSTLLKVLHDCEPLLGPRPMEDVRKRLEIFNKMWEDGTISYSVKVSMAKLATALHKRMCDVAHEIHLALMMDYVSEVGQWMVGIKRLIQEARNLEPSSPVEPEGKSHLRQTEAQPHKEVASGQPAAPLFYPVDSENISTSQEEPSQSSDANASEENIQLENKTAEKNQTVTAVLKENTKEPKPAVEISGDGNALEKNKEGSELNSVENAAEKSADQCQS